VGMKFVVVHLVHESNSFSPIKTSWGSFGPRGPYLGSEALDAMSGTRTGIGGLLHVAKSAGAEVAVPLAGYALPSGPVEASAFEQFVEVILESISHGCDAIMLDLHGAMIVADGKDDADGELLERVRSEFPQLPITVSLDLHANVTAKMVSNCDIIAGYLTYPHVDMFETGIRAGSALLRYLRGEVTPQISFQRIPILAHTLKMNTDEGAMRKFANAAKTAESHPDVLCASSFGGFPMADVKEAGCSVVVVTDRNRRLGDEFCREIARDVWNSRHDFVWVDSPLPRTLQHAKELDTGPILLIDHADNCASGGTQDVMYVLSEALKAGLSSIAVGPIRDPEAVSLLISYGVGTSVSVAIGGKTEMAAIGERGEPLELSGRVRTISAGEYVIKGPQLTGVRARMGRSVAFETEDALIVITEELQEPWDLGVFTSLGVDPLDYKYILLKSRMYFRPVFEPLSTATLYCKGIGVTSSEYEKFSYRKLCRPMFPLDESGFDDFYASLIRA